MSRLTSRNLFDCLFADIAVDATALGAGCPTVREETLLCAANGDNVGAATRAASLPPLSATHIASDDALDAATDTDDLDSAARRAQPRVDMHASAADAAATAALCGTTLVPSLTAHVAAMPRRVNQPHGSRTATAGAATAAVTDVMARVDVDTSATQSLPHASSSSSPFPASLVVTMDASDTAVQAATRFAAAPPSNDERVDTASRAIQLPSRYGDTSGTQRLRIQSPWTALPPYSSGATADADEVVLPHTRVHMSAAEQLARMLPARGATYEGEVVLMRNAKGYGFIAPDVGGPDVYVARDAVVCTFTPLALLIYYTTRSTTTKTHALPSASSSSLGATAQVSAGGCAAGSGARDACATTAQQLCAQQQSTSALAALLPTNMRAAAMARLRHATHTASPTTTTTAMTHADTATQATKASIVTTSCAHKDNIEATTDTTLVLHEDAAAATVQQVPACVLPPCVIHDDAHAGDNAATTALTSAEWALAQRAAALLCPHSAQLLLWRLQMSTAPATLSSSSTSLPAVTLTTRDRVSFMVQYNHHRGRRSSGSGSSSSEASGEHGVRDRLLRAVFVRGVASCGYALPLEQAWFAPLFGHSADCQGDHSATRGNVLPQRQTHNDKDVDDKSRSADGDDTDNDKDEATMRTRQRLLPRYRGYIRTYDADEQRGYIAVDVHNDSTGGVGSAASARHTDVVHTRDVLFYGDAVVWSADVPAAERCVAAMMATLLPQSLPVHYSIARRERNGRCVATLVTDAHDTPFSHSMLTTLDCDDNNNDNSDSTRGYRAARATHAAPPHVRDHDDEDAQRQRGGADDEASSGNTRDVALARRVRSDGGNDDGSNDRSRAHDVAVAQHGRRDLTATHQRHCGEGGRKRIRTREHNDNNKDDDARDRGGESVDVLLFDEDDYALL